MTKKKTKRKNPREPRRRRTGNGAYKLRDIANIKPSRRNRSTRNPTGTIRQGVAPGFRSVVRDGRIVLMTRNGKCVDFRTLAGRRFRDVVNNLVEDLGGGSEISTAELSLICRVATLEVDLGFLESEYLQGNEKLDPDIYAPLAKLQQSILKTLGLGRRAKQINKQPSLSDIRSGNSRPQIMDLEAEDVSEV